MSNAINLHAFLCTWHGWTDKKPSRIKITSLRFNKQYIWLSPSGSMHWEEDVVKHLTELGYDVVGQAEYPGKGWIILSDIFKPLKDV